MKKKNTAKPALYIFYAKFNRSVFFSFSKVFLVKTLNWMKHYSKQQTLSVLFHRRNHCKFSYKKKNSKYFKQKYFINRWFIESRNWSSFFFDEIFTMNHFVTIAKILLSVERFSQNSNKNQSSFCWRKI